MVSKNNNPRSHEESAMSNLEEATPTNSNQYSSSQTQSRCCLKVSTRNILVFVIFLLALTALLLIIFLVLHSKQASMTSEICRTKDCINAANNLIASINTSINPCDDFYAFVCDRWIQKMSSTSSTPTSQSGQLSNNVKNTVKDILNDLLTTNSEILIVSEYLKSCMDLDRIDQNGDESIMIFLDDIWTFLKNGGSLQDLLPIVAKMIRWTSKNIFIFPFSMVQYTNKPSTIKFDQPSLILSQIVQKPNLPENKLLLDAFQKLIKNVFQTLNCSDITLAEVNGIVPFEMELLKFLAKDEPPLEKKMTIQELQGLVKEVDWLNFIQHITNDSLNVDDRFTLSDEIDVQRPNYLQDVVNFLSMDQKNLRQAAVYLVWRVTYEQIHFLPQVFRNLLLDFFKDANITISLPRDELCRRMVTQQLEEAVAYLYVTKQFPLSDKKQSVLMVDRIKDQMRKDLEQADWMSDTTKSEALRKISNMQSDIAYADWLASREQVSDIYKDVRLGPHALENNFNISHFAMQRRLKLLRHLNPKFPLFLDPVTVDGVYSKNLNMLMVSAGMLMPPFYHRETPRYMNYGAVGSVIAHEITHGFDTEGRLRDANGNVADWWTKEDSENFNKRAACFVDQYNNYGENGSLTLQENIADNGGLRLAFNAFQSIAATTVQQSLPNFEEYTPEQMFFLSYGSIWCTTQKNVESVQKHSYNKFRSIGTISNMVEFATAFNCSQNSAMNPEKKCVLW